MCGDGHARAGAGGGGASSGIQRWAGDEPLERVPAANGRCWPHEGRGSPAVQRGAAGDRAGRWRPVDDCGQAGHANDFQWGSRPSSSGRGLRGSQNAGSVPPPTRCPSLLLERTAREVWSNSPAVVSAQGRVLHPTLPGRGGCHPPVVRAAPVAADARVLGAGPDPSIDGGRPRRHGLSEHCRRWERARLLGVATVGACFCVMGAGPSPPTFAAGRAVQALPSSLTPTAAGLAAAVAHRRRAASTRTEHAGPCRSVSPSSERFLEAYLPAGLGVGRRHVPQSSGGQTLAECAPVIGDAFTVPGPPVFTISPDAVQEQPSTPGRDRASSAPSIGVDFAGLGGWLVAARILGWDADRVAFLHESDPATCAALAALSHGRGASPGTAFEANQGHCDIYLASPPDAQDRPGQPCVGWLDPVFRPLRLAHAYVCRAAPTDFVLEITPRTRRRIGREQWSAFCLQPLLARGYLIREVCVNALDLGLPQDRRRRLVIGTLGLRRPPPLEIGFVPCFVPFSAVLDPILDGDDPSRLPTQKRGRSRVQAARAGADATRSGSPGEVVVDLSGSAGGARAVQPWSPCVSSRYGKDLWLLSRGRAPTLSEVSRLQGYAPVWFQGTPEKLLRDGLPRLVPSVVAIAALRAIRHVTLPTEPCPFGAPPGWPSVSTAVDDDVRREKRITTLLDGSDRGCLKMEALADAGHAGQYGGLPHSAAAMGCRYPRSFIAHASRSLRWFITRRGNSVPPVLTVGVAGPAGRPFVRTVVESCPDLVDIARQILVFAAPWFAFTSVDFQVVGLEGCHLPRTARGTCLFIPLQSGAAFDVVQRGCIFALPAGPVICNTSGAPLLRGTSQHRALVAVAYHHAARRSLTRTDLERLAVVVGRGALDVSHFLERRARQCFQPIAPSVVSTTGQNVEHAPVIPGLERCHSLNDALADDSVASCSRHRSAVCCLVRQQHDIARFAAVCASRGAVALAFWYLHAERARLRFLQHSCVLTRADLAPLAAWFDGQARALCSRSLPEREVLTLICGDVDIEQAVRAARALQRCGRTHDAQDVLFQCRRWIRASAGDAYLAREVGALMSLADLEAAWARDEGRPDPAEAAASRNDPASQVSLSTLRFARSMVVGVLASSDSLARLHHSLRYPGVSASRQRDIYPLPLLAHDFQGPAVGCHPDWSRTVSETVDAVIVCLNQLAGIRPPVCFPSGRETPRQAWQHVHLALVAAVENHLAWMDTARPADICVDQVWADLHRDRSGAFPDLQASAVDMLPVSGLFDPWSVLGAADQQTLGDPARLFPNGVGSARRIPRVPPKGSKEYAALVLKGLRAGKFKLVQETYSGGGVFARSKRDSTQQRMIWDGGALSDACAAPPRPAKLLTPTDLAGVRARRPLHVSKRDGRILFDQLKVPQAIVPYLGLPDTSRRALRTAGMTKEEWRSWRHGPSDLSDRVHPASAVWAMGFGWSSAVAQAASNAVCAASGITDQERVSLDTPVPVVADLCAGVATDDVIILSDVSRRRSVQAALAVDDAFDLLGLQQNRSKSEDGVQEAVCVGIALTAQGTCWRAPAASVWRAWLQISAIRKQGRAAPAAVQEILGTLNWLNLLNRPLLSLLDRAYGFARRVPTKEVVRIPRKVLEELSMAALFGIFWVLRPTSPPCPQLLMSDASSTFGLGGVSLPVSPAELGQLLTIRHNAYESLQAADPHEEPRVRTLQWHPLVLDVAAECFSVIIKIRRQNQYHINAEELLALIAVVRWALRAKERFHMRLVVAVDSLVALYAVARGRSSSVKLNLHLRRLTALLLCAGMRLHPVYTPSEWNMSDFPSRGEPLPVSKVARALRTLQQADDVMRRWWPDSNDRDAGH